MMTAKKTQTRTFDVIKGNKKTNKKKDRLCAIVLLTIGSAVCFFEKDITVLLLMFLISFPLLFSKKRFVQC